MARKISTGLTESLFLVGGGVVGAGLALLLAPQSGKKSRRDISRLSRSVSKQSDKVIRNISESMSDFAERVGGMTGSMLHKR
jgi:gas vesicle protein